MPGTAGETPGPRGAGPEVARADRAAARDAAGVGRAAPPPAHAQRLPVRLSPLKFKNPNVLGRCSFTPSTPRQGLRPLRDPDAPELDEDEDEELA